MRNAGRTAGSSTKSSRVKMAISQVLARIISTSTNRSRAGIRVACRSALDQTWKTEVCSRLRRVEESDACRLSIKKTRGLDSTKPITNTWLGSQAFLRCVQCTNRCIRKLKYASRKIRSHSSSKYQRPCCSIAEVRRALMACQVLVQYESMIQIWLPNYRRRIPFRI